MDNRIELGIIASGNFPNEIINETFPRWSSKYIRWVNGPINFATVYVDAPLGKASKYNFSVLGEPKSLFADNGWNNLFESYKEATLCFTYYKELVDLYPNFRYIPGGMMSFIAPNIWSVYPKNKMVSATFSNKIRTSLQLVRQVIKKDFQNKIDFINPPWPNKMPALEDYMFHVAIENEATHFSEKLLDCFLTGTIPIYLGMPSADIKNIFNVDGILFFDTLEELEHALTLATPDYYNKRIPAIQENFITAQKYVNIGDVIWNSGLGEFLDKNE